MPKLSAGLLVHRRRDDGSVEVLLAHPGGPFWAGKDEHAWSVPKGEYEPGDDAELTALREFEEELGQPAPTGTREFLGEFRTSSSKIVSVWVVEGDIDTSDVRSNTFEIEWPPRSGRRGSFPEVDRAEWFDLETARTKIHKGQVTILNAFAERLNR